MNKLEKKSRKLVRKILEQSGPGVKSFSYLPYIAICREALTEVIAEERERCAKIAKDDCHCASLGPYEGKVKCGSCHLAIAIMEDPLKGDTDGQD